MLWLHRTALFQTACRTERKPEFWGENLPSALERGGILGWPKMTPKEERESPFHRCSQKEVMPREEIWSHHLSRDRAEALGSLGRNESPST